MWGQLVYSVDVILSFFAWLHVFIALSYLILISFFIRVICCGFGCGRNKKLGTISSKQMYNMNTAAVNDWSSKNSLNFSLTWQHIWGQVTSASFHAAACRDKNNLRQKVPHAVSDVSSHPYPSQAARHPGSDQAARSQRRCWRKPAQTDT